MSERILSVVARPATTRGILGRTWRWGQANRPDTNELLAHWELAAQEEDGHHLYLTLWNSDWSEVVAKEAINMAPLLQEWLTAILDEREAKIKKEG